MGVGGGIALIVVGAVLTFAVNSRFDAVDLTAIGWICMGAGALTVVLALVINAQRQRTTQQHYVETRDAAGPPPPAI